MKTGRSHTSSPRGSAALAARTGWANFAKQGTPCRPKTKVAIPMCIKRRRNTSYRGYWTAKSRRRAMRRTATSCPCSWKRDECETVLMQSYGYRPLELRRPEILRGLPPEAVLTIQVFDLS